jgi:peroxiredoxin
MKLKVLCAIMLAAAPATLLCGETPAIGEKAPDFLLKNIDGAMVRLADRVANGPVVVVVLRGFPGYQCPYCNRQVADYLKNAERFAEAGARVVLVYPGPAPDLQQRATEFVAGRILPKHFDLLLDPDYEVTNLYGLRWDAPHETAYPSTFVISRAGLVLFRKISKQHGGRTTAAEVLEVLRSSSAKKRLSAPASSSSPARP